MKTRYFLPTMLACLIAQPSLATEVNVVGLFNGKAMISVNGGKPQMLSVGKSTAQGVKLVSADSREAVLEIDGKRQTLGMGQSLSYAATSGGLSKSVVLNADGRGHFFTQGSVNGGVTRFMVDTGATYVSLSGAEARRLGIDYQKGARGMMSTANGAVPAYRITLNTVKVGDVSVNQVEASVHEAPMEITLLGMSFLNRVEMRREGNTLTLTKKP
jgi:aspartyl protease family protein